MAKRRLLTTVVASLSAAALAGAGLAGPGFYDSSCPA
jgi:hypothetical protein